LYPYVHRTYQSPRIGIELGMALTFYNLKLVDIRANFVSELCSESE
jgi:hypothetical protein